MADRGSNGVPYRHRLQINTARLTGAAVSLENLQLTSSLGPLYLYAGSTMSPMKVHQRLDAV